MAFNGSGIFSLVAGNPVVTGTVISSTWANNTLSDIAVGLTDCLTKDGQSTPTQNIPLGNFRITGLGPGVALTDAATLGQVISGAAAQLTTIAGTDTITANSVPAITAYALGQEFNFVASGANATSTVTLNVNNLGAEAVTKYGASGLQPGDIVSGQIVKVRFDGTRFEMMNPTSAPPVVVGSSRNARIFLQSTSSNVNFTADEVIVETALGGTSYKLTSLNLNVNLTTNGAGGFDNGATPGSSYVALYVIYNPTTGTAALLGTNGAVLGGNVYSGGHMPTGFTASALVAIFSTNGSSQANPFFLRDRKIGIVPGTAISTSTVGGPVALNVSSIIPPNALSVGGQIALNSTVASNMSGAVFSEAVDSLGAQKVSLAGTGLSGNFEIDMTIAQFIYYTFANSGGTPTFVIQLSYFRF